jgi:hypothetical protein
MDGFVKVSLGREKIVMKRLRVAEGLAAACTNGRWPATNQHPFSLLNPLPSPSVVLSAPSDFVVHCCFRRPGCAR